MIQTQHILRRARLFLITAFLLMMNNNSFAQLCGGNGCSTNYANFGFNSNNNAATIEYDNFSSAYHSSVIRTGEGKFQIWGERTKADAQNHNFIPQEANTTNYPLMTGTPLKITVGGGGNTLSQVILLTTDGLFAWGKPGAVLSTGINNTAQFTKITINAKTDGLPAGVSPLQVKALVASGGTLGLLTCTGEVWMLTMISDSGGDGVSAVSNMWRKVTTNEAGNPALTNIVSLRVQVGSAIALDSNGKLWVWGKGTYDGSNAMAISLRAKTIISPSSTGTIKMIGITNHLGSGVGDNIVATYPSSPTYYVLYTNGNLYALGDNANKQLGIWNTSAITTWTQPRYSAGGTVMSDIKWISPNEHDLSFSAINVINNQGQIYGWSNGGEGMLGRPGSGSLDPGMPNGILPTEKILVVVTGGHTSMAIKLNEPKIGYTGHYVNGSAGNNDQNTNVNGNYFTQYTFVNMPELKVCGVQTPLVQNISGCGTLNLNNAIQSTNETPSDAVIRWFNGNDPATATQITNITAVPPGTYYAFFYYASTTSYSAASAPVVATSTAVAGTAAADQTIASGTAPTALTLTGSTGSIQWQVSTDNVSFTNVATGGTTASYSPGTLTATRYYRAVVTSGTCVVNSNVVTITVTDPCAISASNPDSDGDGISDFCDLDDDNDGILDTLEDSCETEGTPAYSNDFGTGTTITQDANVLGHTFQANGPFDGFYAVTSGPSQAGYPYAQAAGNKDAGNPVITAGSTNGKYLMINVAPNYGDKVLYRVPNITVMPGTKYRFRLDLAGLSAGAGTIPKLQIVMKDGVGNVLASVDSGNIGMANDDIWRRASMIFTPTISNVTLEIINQQPINTDGNDVGIDNFVLAPYIACDTDGDGIPNRLDLDSDNDGCPDSREGAGNFNPTNTASGNIASQTPNTNFGTAVNTTTGIPTTVGAGQGVGQSQNSSQNDCIDSDGDTIPDWEDLDDDNDGILDTDECIITEKIASGSFDNLGNNVNISSVAGWSLSSGNVFSMTNTYIQFNQENLTQTLSQSLTNINYSNTSPTINIRIQNRDNINANNTGNSVLIQYAGVTYATLASVSGGSGPGTIVTSNGATANTGVLNSYNNGSAIGPFTNLALTLPSNVPTNGILSLVYSAPGAAGTGDDIILDDISLQICGDTDGDGIPNRLDLDSDNDGCSDAIEGASTTITNSNLVSSSMPGGNSGATSGNYNQPVIQNLGNAVNTTSGSASYGVPTIAGSGQAIGTSQNTLVNSCFCYEDPAVVAGATYPVKHGITILGRAGKVSTGTTNTTSDWPMMRNSAYTALESKTKGLVITRNSSPETTIAIPVVGMMVFDTDENAGAGCMKIYTGSGAGEGWKCFNTQTCP